MLNYLRFRRMLTPLLVEILFWIGIVLCLYGGFYNLLQHAVFHGLEVLILGPVILRVLAEYFIVLFKINERLTDLKNAVQE